MKDARSIKEDFPVLAKEVYGKRLVYLDNAATSQKPRSVIQALVDYYEGYNANVHRGVHALSMEATERYEGAREKISGFIGSPSSENVIFTRNTTEGINLVAHTWALAQYPPRRRDTHHRDGAPQQPCALAEARTRQRRYPPIHSRSPRWHPRPLRD